MNLAKKRSFTIIEAVIALALIAFTSAAFFLSLVTSFGYARRVAELRTATLALQEEASVVRGLKFTDIQSLGSSFRTTGMSSLDNASGAVSKSQYGGRNNILKVTFKIGWDSFDGSHASRSVVTLITDHGIDKQ